MVATVAMVTACLAICLTPIAAQEQGVLADSASSSQTATATNLFRGELRIVWGGPTPRVFDGSVSLTGGTLEVVRNLSLQKDSIGAVQAVEPSLLRIEPYSASTFGGVDVIVQGPESSVLAIEFLDPSTREPVRHSVALRDVLQNAWIEQLDAAETKVAVQRLAQDRFRIDSTLKNQVLDTGGQLSLAFSGYRSGLLPGDYSLRARLVGTQDGSTETVFSGDVVVDANGDFPRVPMQLEVPTSEGAFQIEFSLQRRRFLQSLLTSNAQVVRRLDFVAFDPAATPSVISDWEPLLTVDAIAASEPGILSWFSPVAESALAASWMNNRVVASTLSQPIRHGELGSRAIGGAPTMLNGEGLSSPQSLPSRCLTLGADAWLAIPLQGFNIGKPHRLVVRTSADQPHSLIISLKQSAGSRGSAAVGRDYRIDLPLRDCRASSVAEHEILFWPSSGQDYLLLANPSKSTVASVVDVRIDQAVLAASQSSRISDTRSRRIGVGLTKPLLADFFASERAVDPETYRELESWSTWHSACERLMQSLEWSGANYCVLKVAGDGGAIYPSERLDPSCRFDSGAFFSDGRCPEIKDAVELLLRHCDRHGIQLVLALELDSRLPGLSRWEQTEQNSLTQPIWQATLNAAGESTVETQPGLYNPLDERFQSEVVAVLRELLNRYASHPAFGGVQLQLDQGSHLVFRGDRWGYDARALAEFERATRAKLPIQEARNAAFAGSLRLAFMNWRATQMAEFYEQLAKMVASSGSGRRLFLDATPLWNESPRGEDFYHPKLVVRNPSEYLAAMGLDATRLRQPGSNVVLIAGERSQLESSMDADAWLRQVSQRRGLTADSGVDAAAIYYRPSSVTLPEFQKFADAVGANVSGEVFPVALDSSASGRQDLVQQLFHADLRYLSVGGWLPLAGQATAMRQLRATLDALPASAMQDVPLSQGRTNVRVRLGRTASATTIQLINNASWDEDIALVVRQSRAAGERPVQSMVTVADERDVQLRLSSLNQNPSDAASTVQVALQPFDVVALQFEDAEMQLVDVVHAPRDQLLRRIHGELNALEQTISAVSDPTRQTRLANLFGDFELWSDDGKPVGWNVSSLPGVEVTAAQQLPHSGRASLQISNANSSDASAWIQSNSISAPQSRRLVVQAWLRRAAADNNAVVRIAVTGRLANGVRFERATEVGGPGGEVIANDWGTKPATLFVSDLPFENLDELFVSVELIGRGRVWVDDVEISESWLSPEERVYLQGMMLAAKQKLQSNNPFPAEQLLDSYWGHYLGSYQSTDARGGDANRLSARRGSALEMSSDASKSQSWNSSRNVFQQLRDAMRDRWQR